LAGSGGRRLGGCARAAGRRQRARRAWERERREGRERIEERERELARAATAGKVQQGARVVLRELGFGMGPGGPAGWF
jgi:hypothetical protein